MKLKLFFPVFLLLLLGLSVFVVFGAQKHTPAITASPLPSPESFSVQQTIVFGSSRPTESTTVIAKTGESVLDMLIRTKTVEVKEYSFGKMVESIEGIKNGTNNAFWTYLLNNQEVTVGAEQQRLQPNDMVTWEYKAL